eukprot:m.149628 g.149628  ORF g.149628 m.149628 type:complete len:522 (-) comp17351_c1_seq3:12-1577(-)
MAHVLWPWLSAARGRTATRAAVRKAFATACTCTVPQRAAFTSRNNGAGGCGGRLWPLAPTTVNHHTVRLLHRGRASSANTLQQRCVVAVSGGVDSAVAALRLVEQGHDVRGVFMRNWEELDEDAGTCSGAQDQRDAEEVCRHLGIPFETVDFVADYWNDVFTPFLELLALGYTPNPDVLCNSAIKFGALWDAVRGRREEPKSSTGLLLATGHYCQRGRDADTHCATLQRAHDDNKDQTYFLAGLPTATLEHVVFPLGDLDKGEVRRIAHAHGLSRAAERRESMGICFIGKRRRFGDFVHEYLEPAPGPLLDVRGHHAGGGGTRPRTTRGGGVAAATVTTHCTGTVLSAVLAEHPGHFGYTVGQGARVQSQAEKLFVVGKDVTNNAVWVAPADSPWLHSDRFMVTNLSWTVPVTPESMARRRLQVRTRHRQPLALCAVSAWLDGTGGSWAYTSGPPAGVVGYVPGLARTSWETALSTSTPAVVVQLVATLRGITPGQHAVFYDADTQACLGGGTIVAVDHTR